LLPTLLNLAGVGADGVLPGRDLLAGYYGRALAPKAGSGDTPASYAGAEAEETYFVTVDHVLDGRSKHGSAGRRYPFLGTFWRMRYPGLRTTETAVEALIARLPDTRTPPAATTTTWKLVRSFDPARRVAEGHVALFCLDSDPAERRNVAGSAPGSAAHAAEREMRGRLAAARVRHGGPRGLGLDAEWAK
jgi:hypothetical protein